MRTAFSNMVSNTGIGTIVLKNESGMVVSPAYKMMTAWNAMVDTVEQLTDFLETNESQPQFTGWTTLTGYQTRKKFRPINSLGI